MNALNRFLQFFEDSKLQKTCKVTKLHTSTHIHTLYTVLVIKEARRFDFKNLKSGSDPIPHPLRTYTHKYKITL